jgi:phospholipase C
MAKIEHVFVLMLENRSFDHFFAFSGLPGVPQAPASFNFVPGAPNRLTTDPPHEFESVRDQVNGGAMTGFAGVGLQGFVPSALSTLIKLAQNSLFFDNWFSSMPGPTWPNRLFAHAGSSAGLDNSLGMGSPNQNTPCSGVPIFVTMPESPHVWEK